ncbi:hypothetical protein [Facilibium subflavum]|uniref:hypothetical protein n=1 Tax=Facilibium subflavum TaxID=2219058 RepID=UPI0013C36BE8|nr:hypothetical protein [Facilibium subflavum]
MKKDKQGIKTFCAFMLMLLLGINIGFAGLSSDLEEKIIKLRAGVFEMLTYKFLYLTRCEKIPEIVDIRVVKNPRYQQGQLFWQESWVLKGCYRSQRMKVSYQKAIGQDLYYFLADDMPLPKGAVMEASLADNLLQRDTMQAVAGKLVALGCNKTPVSIKRYISVLPKVKSMETIEAGQTRPISSWNEIWAVNACDQVYNLKVRFTGDGKGGTYYLVSST